MDNRVVFLKYTIINGGLTGAYFLLYYLFIEFMSIDYVLSNAISYSMTVLTAYYMTKVYIFKSSQGGKKEFMLFIVVRIAMVGISSIGLEIFVKVLSIGKYISFIIINAVCFIVSYIINKRIFTGKLIDEVRKPKVSIDNRITDAH